MFARLLSFCIRSKRSIHSPDTLPPAPRILVIRFKWIGDVMLTSVLANSLKRTFPSAQVDYLMQEASASLFENHPYVQNVIALTPRQRKNPLAYLRLLFSLNKYDVIVDAQSTNKSELVSLFCSAANAICIGRQKLGRGRFYTHTVDATPALGHKLIERLALLDPLVDLGFKLVRDDKMTIQVPERSRRRFKAQLVERGVSFDRPLFVFAVTAKLNHKKWRLQHIQEVAEHCLRKYNAQLVLYYGSQAELQDVHQFHSEMESDPDIITGIRTKSLMELAALISHCQLFIGNEGGPRHIAQALDVPSVAVFSPSAKKAEWLPSTTRQHQGVEWDDLVDKPRAEKQSMHEMLELGSEQYQALYRMITAQPVIELVDDVAAFAGIRERS